MIDSCHPSLKSIFCLKKHLDHSDHKNGLNEPCLLDSRQLYKHKSLPISTKTHYYEVIVICIYNFEFSPIQLSKGAL